MGMADGHDPAEWSRNADWRPSEVDTKRASAARMYDYYLGGSHNFEVDRVKAKEVLQVLPEARTFARQNRSFLRRAVEYGVRHGVRQFLDLGSGLPTAGNVHEIAQRTVPDARVVYVDNEPVAVTHSIDLLRNNPYATCIQEDILRPNSVLHHPETTRLIDFSQPLMVLMCAVLHFVSAERHPAEIVRGYSDALASGSYLALSHATATDYPERLARVIEIYQQTQNTAHLRSRAETTAMLAPFEHLVFPGVVYTPEWRPEHWADVGNPAESLAFAAVAYLP
ncbi:SAM-dependent methyltransferase [Kutzneria sp. CA-103260]|uniref:SAM-dependent methyltransferase n=1 Tax=Kutzneria sp. CA-103260 TaxID=2802641 RepID=UPI001BEE8F51|nr:SAM-dependent methyltransferase [Kutzneria sp. CA-103260]QUQ67934.1 SAM-dependent methyltransferase [Kutzneria sp. CA-103260]